MAIALIGAILKRNASEQKWKSISEKLQKSHYHLHAPVKHKDRNYPHPTLKTSIELRYIPMVLSIVTVKVSLSKQKKRKYCNSRNFRCYKIFIPPKMTKISYVNIIYQ